MNQDTAMLAALFEKSLNLGPEWTIESVDFREVEDGRDELHIYVVRTPGYAVECPECGVKHGVYDTREREWRHLDIWQYKTIIHCKVPRVDCPEHGIVTADVPWSSDAATHFTAYFEAMVLVMAMSGLTVSGISKLADEHDTRLWRLIRASVDRARRTADYSDVTALGVDETSRKRGHNYLTTFVDTVHRRAIFAVEGKDSSTVASFVGDFRAHGGDADGIRAITCDLSPAFASGIRAQLPNAARIIDKFHVIQLFTKQIDNVRAAESKESAAKRRLLARTKYLWLANEGNLTEHQLEKKRNLSRENLLTARACAMKEAMQHVYECLDRKEAEEELDLLLSWMTHSNIEGMKTVARTMRENKPDILNYFDFRYTNAILEGLNSIIQSAKRTARGFRNPEYFKTVIYLNLGKLKFDVLESCATH